MADGAAAAAAPPRADALKAPPRYSLANAAWPDDQLTRLLPTARGADPALANLLRDPAQAAEAHKIVSELTDDAEALGRLRALIRDAPKHFENNDHEFALKSLAPDGPHGAAAPAARLLDALVAGDAQLFDTGGAPPAPAAAQRSPKKRAAPGGSSRSGSARRRTGASRGGAASPAPGSGMGALVPARDAKTLEPGLKIWIRWDDPKTALHDTWLAATISAQPPGDAGAAEEWDGFFVLEFARPQIDMSTKAFDLVRFAELKRLRLALPLTAVQNSPFGAAPPTVSPTPTTAAKRRSRPSKRPPPPMVVTAATAATAANRLRKLVANILERSPENAGQLSSDADNETGMSAADAERMLADIMLLKSSDGEGRAHGGQEAGDGDAGDDVDGAATFVWGVAASEWHTVLLLLDGFMQAGLQQLEAGAGGAACEGYADAALIVLHMATLSDRPQKLLISETIDTILMTTKRILDSIVFPIFNPTMARSGDSSAASAKTSPSGKQATPAQSPGKSKKTAAKAASGISQVLQCLGDLCRKEALEDAMICSLSTLGISTITVEGPEVAPLQGSGIQLLCTIASRYRDHRSVLFNDVFDSLAKLSATTKRNIRQFHASDDVSIQMVTALFLNLVHSSVRSPPLVDTDGDFEPEWDKSRTDYAEAQTEAKNFLSKFIKKCAVKKEDGDLRVVLERFIADLCAVLNWPAWPAAESALRTLTLMMTHELKLPAASTAKAADSSYRGFLVDMVGTITCRIYKECMACADDSKLLSDAMDVEGDNPNEDEEEDSGGPRRLAQQAAMVGYLRRNDGGDSIPFLVNLWLAEGDSTAEDRQKLLSGLLSNKPTEPPSSEETLEVVQAGSRHLAKSRELLKLQPHLLDRILALFQDSNITLRSKAMKVLSNLMEVCEAIFGEDKVKLAVRDNLYDHAVSVREAAVDMVGRAMALNSQHSTNYLDLILERTLDTGKSVRKRCVRILYDLLCCQPMHLSSTQILLKLSARADDEDSIREMVLGTFRDLWFNPEVRTTTTANQMVQLADTPQREATGSGADAPVPVLTLAQRVKQILDVMAVSKPPDRQRFMTILNALLGRSDRESDARKYGHMASVVSTEQVKELFGKICDQLIEVLLREDEAEGMTGAPKRGRLPVRTCCILAMHVFCETGAEFLVGHITTLQPYLKLPPGASKEDSVLVQYAAHIVCECLPIAENLEKSFKDALGRDLEIIMRDSSQSSVLQVCVKCYCALYEYALDDDRKLRHVLGQYLKQLTQSVDSLTAAAGPGAPFALPSASCKAIFILGCLCRQYAFDTDEEKSRKRKSGISAVMSQVAEVCLRCAVSHCSEMGRVYAVGALGHLACRTPDLLLRGGPQQAMEAAMDADSTSKIKQQVLKSLSEVLVDEEQKHTKATAGRAGRAGKKFSETADDSKVKTDEMGLSGGLMQRYLAQLLALSHDSDKSVRFDAVGLIRVILRQGLVHPIECVAHMVALEGDTDPRVRAQAAAVLSYLEEKHHALLLLRSAQGVLMSYEFQRRVSEKASAFVGAECAFSRVYMFLRAKRAERNQFTSNLLTKVLDEIKGDAVDLSVLEYILSVLSSLPYHKKDEVMTILVALTRAVNLHGETLEEELKQALLGGAEDEDGITSDSHKLLRPLQNRCRAATAVCMLVQLKRYLQTCYGISDSHVAGHSDGSSKDVVANRRTDGRFALKGLELRHEGQDDDSVLWARYATLQAALKEDLGTLDVAASGEGDGEDTSATPNGARGRSAAKRRRSKGSQAKKKKAQKKKPKKKRKKRKLSSVDSDESPTDDSDDSDWD